MDAGQEYILLTVVLLLGLSVLTVSVARRFHFPPILSYIIVGIIVGPGGFSLVESHDDIAFMAQMGIVFLLFSIGLEFSLAQMNAMRNLVFGLGSLQVLVTAALFFAIGWFFGLDTNTNIVIATAFALSSTAIVIKQLTEQGEIQSRHARSAVGILIFQDIMAIPLLILIPALALSQAETSLGASLGYSFLKGILVVIFMFLLGRYVLRPLFNEVASAKSTELFMLTVLLVALGSATLTEEIGLSLTLGAFLAGMMLGETEYRHQIESDIRPFQDILLGLFFITVGMMISPLLILQHFFIIIGVATSIIILKSLIIFALMRYLFKKSDSVSIRAALTLAQVGEFGLVLISLAFSYNLLPVETGQILLSAAVISMMAAPILVKLNGQIASHICGKRSSAERKQMESAIEQDTEYFKDHVILCGFGRVAQTTSRFLRKANYSFVALDLDIARIKEAQLAGEYVYYGDATKANMLRACRIDKAKAIIITYNDHLMALKTLRTVRQLNKDIPVLVRTQDDAHLQEFLDAGANEVVPDIFESSIMLSSHLLLMLGYPPSQILRETRQVRQGRYKMLANFYAGETDITTNAATEVGIIHAVTLDETAFAIGKSLAEFPFEEHDVHVDAVKRGAVRGDNPDLDTQLRADDTVIISGLPDAVERLDHILKQGFL